MTEAEVISFDEMVEGTDAERFQGREIVGLQWVEGGLRIEAEEADA